MPPATGFEPLPDSMEPSADVLSAVVLFAYGAAGTQSDHRSGLIAALVPGSAGSMGELDTGVVIAGLGEPLLRIEELLEEPCPQPEP